MATGQGLTNAREQAFLNTMLRGAALTAPGALWLGLFGGAVAPRSTAVSLNAFYVSATTSNTRVFKVTTAGTTAGTEPAGYGTATDGQTVTDGTAVLTEQTLAMDAIADATSSFIAELSGSGYARLNAGLTAFGAASAIGGSSTGSQSKNSGTLTFATASAAWNPVCGLFVVDASTAGNYWFWMRFSAQATVNNGQALQYNANGCTIQVD